MLSVQFLLPKIPCSTSGLCILLSIASHALAAVQNLPPIYVDRPHGVPLTKKSFYNPEDDFSCLDSSRVIPFEWVNDDYCDCADGTDEPGTAACSNGIFHCINLGHISKNIPSSRVNDLVCDCCDGSDEWAGYIKCNDTCVAEGEVARQSAEKEIQIAKEGHQKRQQLATQGTKTKNEKRAKMEEIEKEKAAIEAKRTELEAKKKEMEDLAEKAKNAHREQWEAQKAAKEAAAQKEAGTALFQNVLDYNKDGSLAVEELRMRKELFGENATELSEEQAKVWLLQEYLSGNQQVDLEMFLTEVYPKLKHLFPERPEVPAPVPTPAPAEEAPKGDLPVDVSPEPPAAPLTPSPSAEEEVMPEYSEETKQLIQAADRAREEFNEVDRKFTDMEADIKKINDFLALDLGPEGEFADLVEKCFEVQVQQYTYKFCPFDKTTQRPTDNSGGETYLGYWGKWDDTPDVPNKYLTQTYDRGSSCWNGPDRKTEVRFICGTEHQLISSSEPAKCEYYFTFHTPLVCEEPKLYSPHTEL